MPISASCSCGRKLNLKDELAGKTVKCPQCGSAVKVPSGGSTATAVATPPPRSAPADSRIMEKPGAPAKAAKPEKEKAGPKVVMANFKSLEDFDDAGNVKKKKKTFTEDEKQVHEVGTTGGEMAKIAAEALSAEEHKPKERCPGCGRGVKPGDVICVKCGTNLKTGRRIGESGFTITRRKLIVFLSVAGVSALGALYHFTRTAPITKQSIILGELKDEQRERADTLAKLEPFITDADPDASRAFPYLANLGTEALPLLIKYSVEGEPTARRKAVKLLEIMAYNGYRSKASVRTLGSFIRDGDTTIRDWAAEALCWSGYDPAINPSYWAASEVDPGKTTDVAKAYALPFDTCRKDLQDAGVFIKLNPNTKKLDFPGNRPMKTPLLGGAGIRLEAFYKSETDPRVKLTRLIQAVRAGRKHLIVNLIYYLELEPMTHLAAPPTKEDRDRAWRSLKEETGRPGKRYDDHIQWWGGAGSKQFPAPPANEVDDCAEEERADGAAPQTENPK